MANRNFNRFQALEKEVKSLYAEISIGSSGAPTLVRGVGIASISRTSAGLYVLTLQDKYNRLMQADVSVQSASAEDIHSQIAAESVDSAKTVTFRTIKGSDGTVVDPASGDTVRVRVDVKNSSV